MKEQELYIALGVEEAQLDLLTLLSACLAHRS